MNKIKNFFKFLFLGFDSIFVGASTLTLFPHVELMPLDDEEKANEIRKRVGLKPYPPTGIKGFEQDAFNIGRDFQTVFNDLRTVMNGYDPELRRQKRNPKEPATE